MSATDPIDEARLALLLGDLRLPGIKTVWPRFAPAPTRRAGPPPASSRLSPSTRSPQPCTAAHRAPPRRGPPAAKAKTLDAFEFEAVPFVGQTVPRTVC